MKPDSTKTNNDDAFAEGVSRIQQIGEIYITEKLATEQGRQELRERLDAAEFGAPESLNEAMSGLIFIASTPPSEERASKLNAAKAEVRAAAKRAVGVYDPAVTLDVFPFDFATLKIKGRGDYGIEAEHLPGILYVLSRAQMLQPRDIVVGSQWVSNPGTANRDYVFVREVTPDSDGGRWIRTQTVDGRFSRTTEMQFLATCEPI